MPKSHILVPEENLVNDSQNKMTIDKVIRGKHNIVLKGHISHKGKDLYYVYETPNSNPKSIEEIDSKVMIALPTPAWEKICINNKFTKTKSRDGNIQDFDRDIQFIRGKISIVSPPYKTLDERIEAWELLQEDMQNDFEEVLRTIEQTKGKGQDR